MLHHFFFEIRLYDSNILSCKGKFGVWVILFIELSSNWKTLDLAPLPLCAYIGHYNSFLLSDAITCLSFTYRPPVSPLTPITPVAFGFHLHLTRLYGEGEISPCSLTCLKKLWGREEERVEGLAWLLWCIWVWSSLLHRFFRELQEAQLKELVGSSFLANCVSPLSLLGDQDNCLVDLRSHLLFSAL